MTYNYVIALGVDAQPQQDYEFVIRLNFGNGYETVRTVMTPEEHAAVYAVVTRALDTKPHLISIDTRDRSKIPT